MDLRHLDIFLQQLNSCSSSCAREAVETLLKIHRNIYFNKEETKYKKLSLQNHAFCSKVWNVTPAQNFMLQCGWTQVEGSVYFDNDRDLLLIINKLLEHRVVSPNDCEWKAETKVENLHPSKQREDMLKAKAAEERKKQLEKFKEDKLYREQLSQRVKQQIADDRKHKRVFTKPVVGNKLNRREDTRCLPPDVLNDEDSCSFRRLQD